MSRAGLLCYKHFESTLIMVYIERIEQNISAAIKICCFACRTGHPSLFEHNVCCLESSEKLDECWSFIINSLDHYDVLCAALARMPNSFSLHEVDLIDNHGKREHEWLDSKESLIKAILLERMA